MDSPAPRSTSAAASGQRLKRKAVRAVPWSLAESLVNGLVGVATILAYAWLLSPKAVGEATIALALVGTVEIVATLGMAEAVIGARSGHTRVSDTAFTASLVAGLLGAGLCLLLAGPVATFYGEESLTRLIPLAVILLVLNTLLVVPTGIVTRKMRAGRLTLRMVTGRVIGLAATIGLAASGFGAAAIVLGMAAGSAASLALLAATLTRWPRPRFDASEFRRLIAFGSAMSLERLIWGLLPRAFWLAVGFIHGPVVLGYFQFAQRLIDETATLAQTFSIRFGLSFFAAMERLGQDPKEAFLKVTRLVMAVAAPAFAGIALVLPVLVGTVFSETWAPAIIVAQVAAIGWIVAFPRSLVGPLLRAKGRQASLVGYSFTAFAIAMAGVAMTGGLGLTAIAAAWVARHVVGLPWGFYATARFAGVPVGRQVEVFARPLLATAIMAAAVFAVGHWLAAEAPLVRLCAMIAAGLIVYPPALALVDRPTIDLFRTLLMQLRRRGRA